MAISNSLDPDWIRNVQAPVFASKIRVAVRERRLPRLVWRPLSPSLSCRRIWATTTRMSSVANVAVHATQFPENIRRDLLESLRTRRVNHKFHYDSVRQTQQWLALHQTYSPSRNDADCAATYDRALSGAAKKIPGRRVHLIGLGCGGGQKDTRLLASLKARSKEICVHTLRRQRRDGAGRAAGGARGRAGRKLFSARVRSRHGRTICRRGLKSKFLRAPRA